jgi:hypothetical protein
MQMSYVRFACRCIVWMGLLYIQLHKYKRVDGSQLDKLHSSHMCQDMDLCIYYLCKQDLKDNQSLERILVYNLHRGSQYNHGCMCKLQLHSVLDKQHLIHMDSASMELTELGLDSLVDESQSIFRMDPPWNRFDNSTWGYDWQPCIQRWVHKHVDKDLYIFDWYKPSDWNIQNYLCIQACNMVVFQSSQASMNMMLRLRLHDIVRLAHKEKADKGRKEVIVESLQLDILQMGRRYILVGNCKSGCDF